MTDSNMRQWALKGAEQRLVEIAAEAARIYAEFPELRDQGRGHDSQRGEPVQSFAPRTRKRRSSISVEGRRRISEAQKARWAKQKEEKAGAATPSSGRQRTARKRR